MNKWQGKNAVVTGASSGIGLAIAKELLKEGLNVIGLARNVERLLESGNLRIRKCDVSDETSVRETFEWIDSEIGAVDVLVNCAGIFHFTSILNSDSSASPSLRDTMATNFLGSVNCAREAYKSMERHGNFGCIINISSVGGHYVPLPREELQSLNTYAPSKHAVTAMSDALRKELTARNNVKIRVSNLSPGETRTQICESTVSGTTNDYYAKNPALDPEEVAAGVVFILSLPFNVQVSQLTMRSINARV